MARAAEIRVGVSGWTYPPWRGQFYPQGVPQRRELAYLSSIFSTVEINGTFYKLQNPDTFGFWAGEVPEDFCFSLKGPRFITHVKRAREITVPLANFFASGPLRLGAKLGPVLWQFPPNFRLNLDLMREFLSLLPQDTLAASRLARKHDHRIQGRAYLRTDALRAIRHAVEIRHESFADPAFIDLLRSFNVALVCADTVEWPRLMDLTADFVYCRLHGSTELYRSGYEAEAIDEWAARIRAWAQGRSMRNGRFVQQPGPARARDVFVYFDNTDKLRAPQDAQALMRKLGIEWRKETGARREPIYAQAAS